MSFPPSSPLFGFGNEEGLEGDAMRHRPAPANDSPCATLLVPVGSRLRTAPAGRRRVLAVALALCELRRFLATRRSSALRLALSVGGVFITPTVTQTLLAEVGQVDFDIGHDTTSLQ